MFVVDTNVLVYAADADASAHRQCRALMDEWRGQESAWYVTWSILYEFLRVSTHPRVLRQPWTADQAWQFVAKILRIDSVCRRQQLDTHDEKQE